MFGFKVSFGGIRDSPFSLHLQKLRQNVSPGFCGFGEVLCANFLLGSLLGRPAKHSLDGAVNHLLGRLTIAGVEGHSYPTRHSTDEHPFPVHRSKRSMRYPNPRPSKAV